MIFGRIAVLLLWLDPVETCRNRAPRHASGGAQLQ